MSTYVRWFKDLSSADVPLAGGKGANLGEMTRAGLPVPPGFVLTAAAYHSFIQETGLRDRIAQTLINLDVERADALESAGARIQDWIINEPIPRAIHDELLDAYYALAGETGEPTPLVAVRSSATMEDTERASFAGMNRSFLDVQGDEDLLQRVRGVWASLYIPRGIYYRQRLGLMEVPEIAVIVQQMLDATASGVAFSIDPATGDPETMVIEGAFGLGEVVVGGQIEPDHFEVNKATLQLKQIHVGDKGFMITRNGPSGTVRVDLPPERAGARVLTDEQVHAVAELVLKDEAHYSTPQDIEWVFADDKLYLVQSRPITTAYSPKPSVAPTKGPAVPEERELVRGLGASPGIVSGLARVFHSPEEADKLLAGDVLVAPMTSPDWVPFMRRAVAIVTDRGGMTSHAAIVSRELGVPCVVATRKATTILRDGMPVTVDGTRGVILEGAQSAQTPQPTAAPVTELATTIPMSPVTATKLMVNMGEPERAAEIAGEPVDGVGLLRAEFMLLTALDGVHPRRLIADGRQQEFIDRMVVQLRRFGEAFAPRPVIYRSTDFRTNEFRGLKGGAEFEPEEANPMIGVRGAFRYVRDSATFRMELLVLKAVRNDFPNIQLMLPFVRTGSELRACKRLIDEAGLSDDRDFELWVMAEVPSITYWLEEYSQLGITGVSIGSNDLTQLMLGIDRDNDALSPLFDERDPAVLGAIHTIITTCRRLGLHSSICGQAPSVFPAYAETLVRFGIDSISVNPDVIVRTRRNIAAAEQRIMLDEARYRAEVEPQH